MWWWWREAEDEFFLKKKEIVTFKMNLVLFHTEKNIFKWVSQAKIE